MTHLRKNKSFRFILSGGGTGGHLFPAIAIANKLKLLYPDSTFLFVGALGKIEMEKVPLSGYKIKGLWISGFQRKEIYKNFLLPLKLIYSFLKSYLIIIKFKPDVVIGTGGYASFPLLYVASLLKTPTLIQEQNFFPGISNKLLAKTANIICTVYDGMEKYFPQSKIRITGNPIREDVLLSSSNKRKYFEEFGLDHKKKTLLMLGGSLGAQVLNDSMTFYYEKFLKENIQVIWQTGRYFNEIEVKSKEGLWIGSFIQDMAAVYTISDLVVSRAGAITISELSALGKPCILVPSPNVAEDHQTRNALALVEKKAALYIRDHELKTMLFDVVMSTINNEELLSLLSTNISSFAHKHSSSEIAQEIIKLIRTNES